LLDAFPCFSLLLAIFDMPLYRYLVDVDSAWTFQALRCVSSGIFDIPLYRYFEHGQKNSYRSSFPSSKPYPSI